MPAKKKFVVAISTFAFVCVAAIVSVVAIFAAQRQDVVTGFKVTFAAADVSARVTANVIVGDERTPMTTSSGDTEVVFSPQQNSSYPSLTPNFPNDEIVLDAQTGKVVFEYVFENDSENVDVMVALNASFGNQNNLDVKYSYAYSRIADVQNMSVTNSCEPLMLLGLESSLGKSGDYYGKYSTLYVYVEIAIRNLANDASFSGSMFWGLEASEFTTIRYSSNIDSLANKKMIECRQAVPINKEIKSLPAPKISGDSTIYSWFNNRGSESFVEYPINLSSGESLDVFYKKAPYVATIDTSGLNTYTATIKNLSDSYIVVDPNDDSIFSFGYAQYDIDAEYLVVQPESSVTIELNHDEYQYIAHRGYLITEDGVDSFVDIDVYFDAWVQSVSLNTNKFYSAYGEYPQTYVGDNLNDRLKSAPLTKTGKTYTIDMDGTLVVFDEVVYRGSKYVCVENAMVLSYGVTFTSGETYYFHVEPIVARAMGYDGDGRYKMMTASVLGSIAFNPQSSSNSWMNSNMRLFLNTHFLNDSGLKGNAMEVSIFTNLYGSGDTEASQDEIWLPSVDEVLSWSGGDVQELIENGETFTDGLCYNRKGTDFSIVTNYFTYSEDGGGGCYYTRSPGPTADGVAYMDSDRSGLRYAMSVGVSAVGFCPCFVDQF